MHTLSSAFNRRTTSVLRLRKSMRFQPLSHSQPRILLTADLRPDFSLRQLSNSAHNSGPNNHRTHAFNSSEASGTVKGSTDVVLAPAPAAPPPEGQVGIVFTDIVKSTAIWEANAEVMAVAMQMHDEIIRSLTHTHQGYEVKQNGDGFMIAFATATSALQFCLDVQQRLLEQEWPEELLKLQPGKEASDHDGNVLFRGLRLRMSAHWGEPVCTWNRVIDRMDYLGPVVNRAARFVQVTEGGQIVVSEEFLLQVQKAEKQADLTHTSKEKEPEVVLDLQELNREEGQQEITGQRFDVQLLGKAQFKGLPEEQKLYFINPQSLRGREELWPKNKYIEGSKGNIIQESG